ncbi:MAG: hypothetical protein JNJ57_15425 [Saprospiraceae bacterium]|nr:hypothetical protein [Saprospiraceae bacterium]
MHQEDTTNLKLLLQHLETLVIIVLFLLGVAAFIFGAARRLPWPGGGTIDRRGSNLLLGIGSIFMLVGGVWWYVNFQPRVEKKPKDTTPVTEAEGNKDTMGTVRKRTKGLINENSNPEEISLKNYPPPNYLDFYTLHTGLKRSILKPIEVENKAKYISKETIIIEKNQPYLLIEFRADSTLFTNKTEFKLYFNATSAALFDSSESSPEGWQPEIEPPFYFYRAQTRYLHPFKMLLK